MPEQQNPEQQLEYLKELRAKYEVVLADAQKTGDYSEAEKLKEELESRLSALEALFPKSEAKAENQETESKEVTETRAREIMGEDFFGFEEIHQAFGDDLSLVVGVARPEIHYSEKDLLEAKINNEMLILRTGMDREGRRVTMKRINEIAQPRMTEDEGLLLNNAEQYNTADFYAKEPMKTKWVLVRKYIVPHSTNKDYISQTRALRDYLHSIGALTEQELIECSDDYLNKINEVKYSDTKFAVSQLAKLSVNKNHRRSPAEVLYDSFLQLKNRKESYDSWDDQDWTNTPTVMGGGFTALTALGYRGAAVLNYTPLVASDSLGVISVR